MMQARLVTAEDIMSKRVLTIPAWCMVGEALKIMADEDVGSLVVMDEHDPIGILSERDLVSKLMAKGKPPENTLATEVMSGDIVKLRPNVSLKEAAKTMNSKKSRLLVFEGDQNIGILTATDIVRGIHEMDRSFDIEKVVSKSVFTLKAETPLHQAVGVMSQLRVGSIIITKTAIRMGSSQNGTWLNMCCPRISISTNPWGIKLQDR
jgi:predicted transcriptional regulator